MKWVNKVNEQFYAYLAGFLDGDGCFGLIKHKNPRVKRGFSWYPHLSIGQISKEYLEWLKDKIGGFIINQHPMYILVLTSGYIRPILPKVLPYLRRKKEEAELLSEAVYLLKHTGRGTGHYGESDPRLEQIYKELKLLKPRNLYRKQKKIKFVP